LHLLCLSSTHILFPGRTIAALSHPQVQLDVRPAFVYTGTQ
jgi:hypothetical protein